MGKFLSVRVLALGAVFLGLAAMQAGSASLPLLGTLEPGSAAEGLFDEPRRRGERERHAPQPPRDQLAIADRTCAEREVDPLFDQVHHRVRQHQLQLDARVTGGEGEQRRADALGARHHRRGDA